VSPDTELFRLASPDLDHKIAQAKRKLDNLQAQVSMQSVSQVLQARGEVVWQELQSAAADLDGLRAELAQLSIRAPFDGLLTDIPSLLASGTWVAAREPLGLVVDPVGERVEAYITENELLRIDRDGIARFHMEDAPRQPIRLRVVSVDQTTVKELSDPELASTYDGPIAVRPDAGHRLVPDRAVFRVTLTALEPSPISHRALRGYVVLEAEPVSIAALVWRSTLGVLVREGGF
jgi:putative peptide zinc metalloprotease protein